MYNNKQINIIKVCIVGVGVLSILLIFMLFAHKGSSKRDNILSTSDNQSYTLADMEKKQPAGNVQTEEHSTTYSPELNNTTSSPTSDIAPVNNGHYQAETSDVKEVERNLKKKQTTSVAIKKTGNGSAKKSTIAPPTRIPSPTVETSEPVKAPAASSSSPNLRGNRHRTVSSSQTSQKNVTQAVIQGDQTVKSRGTVRIRLLEDFVSSNGTKIPKNSSVFGVCNLTDNRLFISITSAVINGTLYNVNAIVYDLDGQKGINVPGSTKNEIRNDATGEVVNDINPVGVGVIGMVANAASSVTKAAIRKKVSTPIVNLKANYKIYLAKND